MLKPPDTTLVLGIDAKTITQVAVSHLTWRMFYPELFEIPWLVFYDATQVNTDQIERAIAMPKHCSFVAWGMVGAPGGIGTQRERMLTGFVHVPCLVGTKWWMKLDTDAIALARRDDWLDEDWFDLDRRHVYVANRWGYTKAKGDDRTGAEWAESLESFGDIAYPGTERLGLSNRVDGRYIKMSRMASWLSFYRTSWTKSVVNSLARAGHVNRLPVPSQDTVHWYAAERDGQETIITKFKKRSWTNIPNDGKLRAKVDQLISSMAE